MPIKIGCWARSWRVSKRKGVEEAAGLFCDKRLEGCRTVACGVRSRRRGQLKVIATIAPKLVKTSPILDGRAMTLPFSRANSASEGSDDSNLGEIFIPCDLRGQRIADFPFSVRLRHVLERRRIKLLGDLHGLSTSEFSKLANCGKKTLAELVNFVRSVHAGVSRTVADAYQPIKDEVFSVAPNAAKISVRELPISVRLSQVLAKKGIETLGQLNGVAAGDLLAIGNCGRKTVAEVVDLLQRSADGEFETDQDVDESSSCWLAVLLIDRAFQSFSPRNQEIVLWRLGGYGDPLTLEEVGSKFKLTRERVRQVVEKTIRRIRTGSGPRMSLLLRRIAAGCEEKLCPLTPELLRLWLGEHEKKRRFPLSFYVRLLRDLNPEIPAWPRGQDGRGSEVVGSDAVMDELERVLREKGCSIPLKTAFTYLCSANFPHLQVTGFLGALRASRYLKVEFKQPDQPELTLGRLRAVDLANAALQSSGMPLTPEEILERAEKLFAPNLIDRAPRTLSNSLTPEQGFYLLGPRAYGLRQHFQLPQKDWSQIKAGFVQMLEKTNRPVSTPDFLSEYADEWGARTNSYELAQILREDQRFVDLGRRLFALAEWGVEERPHIKDLVAKILTDSGRLMTATEILEQLQTFRSVSGSAIPTILRGHPLVRDYGFGHFGLRSWGDAPKSEIVSSAAAVERIIRRADPPLTMNHLCEIVGIAPHGELADKIWRTCQSLKTVVRKPDECSPETVLLHKKCPLERALVATARQVSRPMPVYEIQWELNERFGALFEGRAPAEIERCLRQSPMFVRDADGNFILDEHFDQTGFDVAGIRAACFAILSQANEIIGCEDLLDRLESEGKGSEDLSPSILAAMLRGSEEFEEVGHNRFRAKKRADELSPQLRAAHDFLLSKFKSEIESRR